MSLRLWRILSERKRKQKMIMKGDVTVLLSLSDCVWVVLNLSLTLRDFEILLQRHQLQPEELGHLLVLLSLPEVQYSHFLVGNSNIIQHIVTGSNGFIFDNIQLAKCRLLPMMHY